MCNDQGRDYNVNLGVGVNIVIFMFCLENFFPNEIQMINLRRNDLVPSNDLSVRPNGCRV